jgi:hypothetical protein
MMGPTRYRNALLGAALLAQGLAGGVMPGLSAGAAPGPSVGAGPGLRAGPVPGLAAGAGQGLAGGAGDPIAAAAARAMRPAPRVGPAPAAGTVWVPARQVFIPGTGGSTLVPGHYERVISPTQVFVPPLIVLTESGASVTVPAGERPPVDVRPGP